MNARVAIFAFPVFLWVAAAAAGANTAYGQTADQAADQADASAATTQPTPRPVYSPQQTPQPQQARSSPWLAPPQREEYYDLDWQVLDHTGRALNMRELLGKPMAVSLIYTRCPNPNMCPLMTALMADLEQRLAATGLAGRAWLVLISFDPTHDTPAILRDYMTGRGIDFSSAIGIIPSEEQVKELVWEFGTVVRPIHGGLLDHSIDMFLLDAQGRFVRYHTGRVWDNEVVAADLRRLIEEDGSGEATAAAPGTTTQPAASQPAAQAPAATQPAVSE